MCTCFRESGKSPADNALLKMYSRYLVMLGGSFVFFKKLSEPGNCFFASDQFYRRWRELRINEKTGARVAQ